MMAKMTKEHALIPTFRAKRLRRDQTDAERKLWMHLRSRQMNGFKFRRQQPIGRYIVDFFCPESRLVLELDGGHHADQVQADQRRTEFLTKAGYRVLRFWDNEVLTDTEAVLQKISNELNNPSPQPSPSRGEGEGKQGARESERADR
jgi:very-short-patch-repair endonuclease